MKQFLFATLLLGMAINTKAQWTTTGSYIYNTTTANNVGIGTSTSQPFKLSINGTAAATDRKFGINGNQILYLPDQSASVHWLIGNWSRINITFSYYRIPRTIQYSRWIRLSSS